MKNSLGVSASRGRRGLGMNLQYSCSTARPNTLTCTRITPKPQDCCPQINVVVVVVVTQSNACVSSTSPSNYRWNSTWAVLFWRSLSNVQLTSTLLYKRRPKQAGDLKMGSASQDIVGAYERKDTKAKNVKQTNKWTCTCQQYKNPTIINTEIIAQLKASHIFPTQTDDWLFKNVSQMRQFRQLERFRWRSANQYYDTCNTATKLQKTLEQNAAKMYK